MTTKLRKMRESNGIDNVDLIRLFCEHPKSEDPYDVNDLILATQTAGLFFSCEIGFTKPSDELLRQFADKLGCSLDDLKEVVE
jgi:hypothetical protein